LHRLLAPLFGTITGMMDVIGFLSLGLLSTTSQVIS
jgi:hypothetical protein